MTEEIEVKLKILKEYLLDKDYPLGIDEILGSVQDLFIDNEEIKQTMNDYINEYYKLLSCAIKFDKVKDLVDEEFYSEVEE